MSTDLIELLSDEDDSFDFINEYVELLDKVTDAPHSFKHASAMFLISTCVGRRFLIFTAPETNLFDDNLPSGMLLNLWFMFIGKTRISRKSTVIGYAENCIKKLDDTLALHHDFTPQSFISDLSAKQVGDITRAAWIHDEVSGFFESLSKRDFMTSIDSVMSRIYDGRSYNRSTIGRGSEKIPNPYLTTLLASTEVLPTLFTEHTLRQGFLNRFTYIVGKREGYRPLTEEVETEEVSRKSAQLFHWLETLLNYQGFSTFLLDIRDGAKQLYDDYERKIESDIDSTNHSMLEGFLGNIPNVALRFAAIFKLSRMSVDKIEEARPYILIQARDMRRAIEYADGSIENYKRVLNMWEQRRFTTPEDVQIPSSRYDMLRFLEYANTHGGLCSIAEICRDLNLSRRVQVGEVLGLCVTKGYFTCAAQKNEQGTLSAEEYARFSSHPGPSPQVFRLTEEGRERLAQ